MGRIKNIYSKVPRLTVDLIIRMQGGIVLTLRSLPSYHNQWHFPGGTVLYGETIQQAVTRVAQDELGITVTMKGSLGYIEYPSEPKERGFGWSIALPILCDATPQELKINDEASKVEVFSTIPENTIAEQKEFLRAHWHAIFRQAP